MEAPVKFLRMAIVTLGCWALALPCLGQKTATLSRARFTARGMNEAELDVSVAGRYALMAKSQQGARVQIVDRMAGPAEADGEVGGRDGRLDLFLDSGRYKVLITSPAQGKGEVSLDVRPFTEVHQPDASLLVEQKVLQESLEDFHQLSWWVQVPKRQAVYLEAQGRNLADLRLWKDGTWLQDASLTSPTVEPIKGRPERSCLLVADLQPGVYRVTAYGGKALPWAKETGGHPFSLRMGLPSLPSAARIDGTVSAFGCDRYLIPSPADTFFLQLAEKKDFRMDVASFSVGQPVGRSDASATIGKRSADPQCKIHRSPSKPFVLLTVSGAPGERYTFQCFEQRDTDSFSPSKPEDRRISTLHSGYAEDNIDATCILVASGGVFNRPQVVAADVVPLGGEKGWARRFNLLGENTVFLQVEEAGDYELSSSGVPAQVRLEPFLVDRSFGYVSPGFKQGGGVFSLDKGYWVLTIQPDRQGILKVALHKQDRLKRLTDWVNGQESVPPQAAKASSTLEQVHLEPKYNYTLYLNRQEGVDRGIVHRSLPLRLEHELPLTLQGGQEQSIPFSVPPEGDYHLRISALARAPFTCTVDGTPWSESTSLAAGPHVVRLRNEGPKSVIVTLRALPGAQMEGAVPASLPASAKQVMQIQLPSLVEGHPLAMDLGVQEVRTTLLSVQTPGLYHIESTGLLKTRLTLRTAIRTKLFSAEANGVGRNGRLSEYLKEGTYLLSLQTLDRSAGHTGLRVVRTEVTEGGSLSLGREGRSELSADQGILYTFEIPKAGKYVIRTLGQNRLFPSRLEDGGGWPLVAPGTDSNLTRDLTPGRYRFMSLPLDVDSLRITTVEPAPEARKVEGRGPHPLAFNQALGNRWRAPAAGAPRAKDVYVLKVPADLDVKITLGEAQMQGFLTKVGSTEAAVVIPPSKGWSGLLPAGDYRLEVECSRLNDLLDYTVQVSTDQLAPGLSRAVTAPAVVPIRLARETVVELSSRGQIDVQAHLYKARPSASGEGSLELGELVEANDDAYHDWNFRIIRRLPAGAYLLQVDPVGGTGGATTVAMAAPEERRLEPSGDGERALDLADGFSVLPLRIPENSDLFCVRLRGASQLGCILERVDATGTIPIHSWLDRDIAFQVPLRKGGGYQLRLWSADHQGGKARLQVRNLPLPLTPVEGLSQSPAKATDLFGERISLAKVRVGRGGTFAAKGGLSFSTSMDQPLLPGEDGLAPLPAGVAYLRLEGGTLARMVLGHSEVPLRLRLPKGTSPRLDVAPSAGGPILVWAKALVGRAACAATVEGARPFLQPTYALGRDTAATVLLPQSGSQVTLWNPQEEAPAISEWEVKAKAFPVLADEGGLIPGLTQGSLKAGVGRQWDLGPGGKQVDLILEEGLAAYLSDGAAVVGVAFTQGDAAHASFLTRATRLTVLSLAKGPASFEVALRNRSEASFPSTPSLGQPFEVHSTTGGSLQFDLPAREGSAFSASGSDVACEWMDAKGILHSGLRHDIQGGGQVRLTYGPGLVKAWVSEKDRDLEGRWGRPAQGAVLPLQPNSILPLQGGPQWFSFSVVKPSTISLRSEGPAAYAVWREGSPVPLTVAELSLETFLTPGTYRLGVRGLGGQTLNGFADVRLAEVVAIDKTFGPDTLIHGGETRVFSFTVKEASTYGLGLRAGRDALSCELIRSDGAVLGAGAQQFMDLGPGTYLLKVGLPVGEEPLKFTPVVVGLEAPGNGPPEQVVRAFLAQLEPEAN